MKPTQSLTGLDFTIRYEGTKYVLYKFLGDSNADGKRERVYLGSYSHKEKAIAARDQHIEHFTP